ncbi:hypothetical protein ACLB2K_048258 [Fragaria x ananassa]
MRAEEDDLKRAIMEDHIGEGEEKHFLGALLSIQEKYDLTQDDIGGLLWGQVSAGLDTVAISAEWAMAELIKNPRVLRKAQEELDRVIGLERPMMEADISNLPYLKCVAKEALRLHPPIDAASQSQCPYPQSFRPERFIETKEPGFGKAYVPSSTSSHQLGHTDVGKPFAWLCLELA